MEQQSSFISRVAGALVIIMILGYILIIGKAILIPLTFSILFSFLLRPPTAFFERLIRNQVLAILLTFLLFSAVLAGMIAAFAYQLVDIVQALPSIGKKVTQGLDQIFLWLKENFAISPPSWSEWVQENASTLIETPFSIVSQSLSSSTAVIAGLGLTLIFTFFFLLYRTSFKNFIIYQFNKSHQDQAKSVILEIQDMLQSYLQGLGTVILILAVLNSTGLWLIGIAYPVFWGVLAAFLAVIPYIGTMLGGLFPFLYALATATSLWQPVAVIILYQAIQQIEGNFITPRIVGSSVQINPLVAMISLFVFGMIWGIAGIILSIPAMAVIKIIFDEFDGLKPLGVLLGSKVHQDEHVFADEFDEDRYRLINYFSDTQSRNQKPGPP
jgi:predicted PurR-regulated permease PerM